jgi:purine-nucleoside phosphorylase
MTATSSDTKAATTVSAPAQPTGDADLVRQAYEDAVRTEVGTLIGNYINQDCEADAKFLAGLAILRKARDRALELVGKG